MEFITSELGQSMLSENSLLQCSGEIASVPVVSMPTSLVIDAVLQDDDLRAHILHYVLEIPNGYKPKANFPWDLLRTGTAAFTACRSWRISFREVANRLRATWTCKLKDCSENCANHTLTTPNMPTMLDFPNFDRQNLEKSGDVLVFDGQHGALLVPSLDCSELLERLGIKKLTAVTVCVGVNSDAYNNGLGAGVLPSVEMNTGGSIERSYIYSGYLSRGLARAERKAIVKFHPGMSGGQLRLEGPGGFRNQNIAFTPLCWSEVLTGIEAGTQNGQDRLHQLEFYLSADGHNEVRLRTGGYQNLTFEKSWDCILFDGRHLPAVFCWKDLDHGGPLYVGPVKFLLHK
uniref:Uncharacterized protein n=1 Tax=Fibrocapsa japonica TaxID=94617 RepID=A0A7S2UU25_9STRA|mmetsp:Transcript_10863/g.16051  ORF Transcript_10863/g.16051 Transcript_10863/m.16051 type:complete len:346 (+) Transcript_10863:91-1128(+)|eukprot:CAMPEP_0113943708 /NCGR_PEP_ID=MMETSP1339-20121228/26981_1 /TAXON_ID=94617 /ORGANISM="Fibrocapsa japonica" /LENGTH=345 /DNA_ID=CAMNT_0000948651 /DNA_START=86 /DNA_END=1123 /DNA_ORIENTATION=+ /assembly_acc=CAM_ASM_000762